MMKASIVDLRRRMKDVLEALDRNEPVTVTYRGKEKGILYPIGHGKRATTRVVDHPAFGMWRDRKDLRDVKKVVRSLREARHDAV
jgi:prevent-host-death family protein